MSSEGESHSVENVSGLQGPSEEESSLGMEGSQEALAVSPIRKMALSFREEIRSRTGSPTDSGLVGPSGTASILTRGDIAVIRERYGLTEANLVVPSRTARVDSGIVGCVAVYEGFLKAGLRFPLHSFIRNVLNFYQLVPSQLVPNPMKVILCFVVLCHLLEILPRSSLFRAFFLLKRHPRVKGWWCFVARPRRVLVKDLPTSIHGWKDKFFFVQLDPSLKVSSSWREPYTQPNRNDGVLAADRVDFEKLANAEVPPHKELLSELSLYEAGLSPLSPQSKSI